MALSRCWSVPIWVAAACTPRPSGPAQEVGIARAAIAAQIARSVQATRDKDIDALLSVQTPDFTLQNDTAGDEHSELLTPRAAPGQPLARLVGDRGEWHDRHPD